MHRLLSTAALAAGIALSLAGPALAQYPERPITFIIATNPGGTTDVGVRTWLPYLEQCLGNNASINVVYQPGAQNRIGFTAIATAEPDGYTLGAFAMPNLATSVVEGGVQYDIDSFVYLGSFYASAMTINVRRSSEYESFDDLREWSAENETPVVLGISRLGSDDHFLGMRLANAAELDITFIPFGDAALARNALLGGHIGISAMSITETIPFREEVRTLGVSSEERFPGLPEVPTFRELGFDVLGGTRHTFGGPAGIPEEIVSTIRACADEIAVDPDFIAESEARALLLDPMGGEAVAAFMRDEFDFFSEMWESDPWN